MARRPLPHHWPLGSCWQERHADSESPVLGPFRRRTFIGTIPGKEGTQDTYYLRTIPFFLFSLWGKACQSFMSHASLSTPDALALDLFCMPCSLTSHNMPRWHAFHCRITLWYHPPPCNFSSPNMPGMLRQVKQWEAIASSPTWVYICRYRVPFTVKHTTRRWDIGQHNTAMTRNARQYRALKKRNFIYQIHRHRPNLFGHSPNCDQPLVPWALHGFFSLALGKLNSMTLRPSHPTLTINFPTHTHSSPTRRICTLFPGYTCMISKLYPWHEPFAIVLDSRHSTKLPFLYSAQCPPQVLSINSWFIFLPRPRASPPPSISIHCRQYRTK